MSPVFPRVLVVAPIRFNLQAGGGVTMGNLFRSWPKDALAQIHSDRFTTADDSVCRHYLEIDPSDFPLDRPFRSRIVRAALLARAALLPGEVGTVPEGVLEWARAFRPDVIYARPLDAPVLYWSLPYRLAGLLGVPYVVHVMDDWPARLRAEAGGAASRLLARALDRALRRLFADAALRFAISGEMCAAFQARWGLPFEPFANCIELAAWRERLPARGSEPAMNLVFVGAVASDKELGSLRDVASAVTALRQGGAPATLRIYSAPQWRTVIEPVVAENVGVSYEGYVHPDRLPAVLGGASALVLAVNFDPASLSYVGYSLQNKVPEYLASEAPVLVYGPEESANVAYARRCGWGLVVSRRDGSALQEAIRRVCLDTTLRASLVAAARAAVEQNHDAGEVRRSFRLRLAAAAAGRQGVAGEPAGQIG